MLMRKFTRREKALLILLVLVLVVGFYFLLVHRPVEAKLTALAAEKEDLELKSTVVQVRLTQRNQMQEELDEIFAQPKDQITVMPAYDNIEALMVQFNSIFTDLDPKLSFPAVRISEEGVVTRPIEFGFVAPSYDQARVILTSLARTGQRSLLDGLSITPVSNTAYTQRTNLGMTNGAVHGAYTQSIQQGPVSVEGTIYFYELSALPKAEE